MSLELYVLIWAVLVSTLCVLAVYRIAAARGERTLLHVRDSEIGLVPGQIALVARLERLDALIKLLAVASLAYTLLLPVAVVTYLGWREWTR